MGRAKTPDQWSPAYRRRMERVFANNPFATKTEARRGANSKEAVAEREKTGIDQDDYQAQTQANIKAKISNVTLREELGVLTHDKAAEIKTKLKTLGGDIDTLYSKLVVGTRAYDKKQDEIKALYWELYAEGMFGDDDDPFGDIFYH